MQIFKCLRQVAAVEKVCLAAPPIGGGEVRREHNCASIVGQGHSYGVQPVLVIASLDAEEFAWGQDLFNHGYYWEAHEAWEGIWQIANRGSPLRAFLKGLILLCATGVKIREVKRGSSDASR